MASSLWKISVDDAPAVTLDSLGIQNPTVNKASLDIGTLTFKVKVQSITTPKPFTYGQKIVLLRGEDIFFVGFMQDPAANFNAQESSWSMTVNDAWWKMGRTVYRQPAVVWNTDATAKIGLMSTKITLNQDAWGRQISQADQLANIMAYAEAVNSGAITSGASPAVAEWPKEETRDITVAEAVRRAASVAPSAYAYPEYSAGIWALTWASRGGLGLVTLDLEDADKIMDVSGLRARNDLVPPGVVFDFLFGDTDSEGNGRQRYIRQFGGTPGADGTIYATFQLGACDTAPEEAAAAYYDALKDAHYEGTLRLMEQECTGELAPGKRLRLMNGQTEWETMDAVVQRCTYDLDSGQTTFEIGPSEVLGADDFVTMLNRLRNRPAPTGWCNVQHNGTEGVEETVDDEDGPDEPADPDDPQPDDPLRPPGRDPDTDPGDEEPNEDAGKPGIPAQFPYIDIEYCNEGTPRTARLVGFDIGPA